MLLGVLLFTIGILYSQLLRSNQICILQVDGFGRLVAGETRGSLDISVIQRVSSIGFCLIFYLVIIYLAHQIILMHLTHHERPI